MTADELPPQLQAAIKRHWKLRLLFSAPVMALAKFGRRLSDRQSDLMLAGIFSERPTLRELIDDPAANAKAESMLASPAATGGVE